MGIYLLRKNVPQELKSIYPKHYWSTRKLWALEKEVSLIPIRELLWNFTLPLWYGDRPEKPAIFNLNPEAYPSHQKRVSDCDLSYPLHAWRTVSGIVILDGVHRLIKHQSLSHPFIPVKILTAEELLKILPESDDFRSGYLAQEMSQWF